MMETIIIFIFFMSGFFALVWLDERPHTPTMWDMAKALLAWFTLNTILVGIFL